MSSAIKKVFPLFDRVLVRRIRASDKTASGIYIPEKAKSQVNRGQVVAVGPGIADKVSMTLKPGDFVLLPSFGGTSVEMEPSSKEDASPDDYLLFKESEILARIQSS